MLLIPPIPTLFPYTTALPIFGMSDDEDDIVRSVAIVRELCSYAQEEADQARELERAANDARSALGQFQGMVRCLFLAGLLELRSEEHTSELQSHVNLVCRLLL